jgi:hypothetical protein
MSTLFILANLANLAIVSAPASTSASTHGFAAPVEPVSPSAEPTTVEPPTEAPPPTPEPAPAEEAIPPSQPAPPTAVSTPAPPPDPMQLEELQREPEGKGQFSFFWDMNQPVGSSFDFVDDFSVRGFSAAFSYRVIPELAIGFLSGYTYTDDIVRATRTFDDAALTATELRTIMTVPLMATATFHIPTGRHDGPRGRGWADPFIGLGIGTYYTFRQADIGWSYAYEDGWHFGLMPTLGVQIDTPGPQVILSSRLNWAAKTENSPQELFMTFNVGLGFFAF